MLRDLSHLPAGFLQLTQASVIDWSYAVRLDIAAPVGTVRFTDRHSNFTANVDGTSQTWVSADMKVGKMPQGRQKPLDVTQLNFANLDYTWTNWANSPGLRKAEVRIWKAWFDPLGLIGLPGAYVGPIEVWRGHVDNQELLRRAKLALKPWSAKWARRAMTAIPGLSPELPAPLMPKEDEEIHWVGSTR